jgi:tetratricopeptide (TPR) repeat protein
MCAMKIFLTVLLLLSNVADQEMSLNQAVLQGEKALAEGAFSSSEGYLRLALAKVDSASLNKLDKARIQIDLASLLTLSGRDSEAEEQLQNALMVLRVSSDAGKPYLPNVLINLGAVYTQTGQYRKSESTLSEAKRILEGVHSDIRAQVDLLTNLGILYAMTGRGKLAQGVLEQAIALNNEKGDGNSAYRARTLTNLATLYCMQKKWGLAEPALIRAQEVIEVSMGPTHPELAGILNNLGYAYAGQKKLSKAEGVLRRAVDVSTLAFGEENLRVATMQMHLAEVLTEEGELEEAQSLYSRALAVQERLSGPHSPNVASILEHLAKLLRLKIDQQARDLEARAKAIRKEQALVRSVH